jgi:amidase
MTELTWQSATELTAALRSREVSSRELLDAFLARIAGAGGALNAVVTLDEERARAEAVAADEDAVHGRWQGPLHGLPMTVKDVFETAGIRTVCGTPELAGHVPTRDADAVARLRGAGAVVFGKTNVPTGALDLQTSNPVFGTTLNPWDHTRSPSGSAGGAAAALAAGLTGLELGSDLAGSIRVPAHACGVFGLKPSYGVVPLRGHIPGPPGTLSAADMAVAGPMGRSADDLDLGLDVLAGPDVPASVAWRLALPRARRDSLADYRMATWLDDTYSSVDAEVLRVLTVAVRALDAAGARIDVDARPVALAESDGLFRELLGAVISDNVPSDAFEFLLAVAEAPTPDPVVEPDGLTLYARSVTQRKRDWNVAHERRAQLAARWADFFRDHDVLLCPVSTTVAIPHDLDLDPGLRTITVNGETRPYFDQMTWTGLAGVSYLPAAVVPVGTTEDGLPVGLQVIGAHLEDRTVVDVARRVAGVLGGFRPPPPRPRGRPVRAPG